MKKLVLLPVITIALGLFTYSIAWGQKAEVEKKLQEYGIPHGFFENNLNDENANHSFKLKTTTITSEETKVMEGTFDPTLPDGERWKLISVNGNEPTSKEIKQFHKEELLMDARLLGQTVEVTENNEFYDYKKVR